MLTRVGNSGVKSGRRAEVLFFRSQKTGRLVPADPESVKEVRLLTSVAEGGGQLTQTLSPLNPPTLTPSGT